MKNKPILDYSALSRPVSREEKRRHKYFRTAVVTGIVSATLLILATVGMLLLGPEGLVFAGYFLGVSALLAALGTYADITDDIRLKLFAKNNNLNYQDDVPYDDRPGVIFHEGHSKTFLTLITTKTHIFSEIGVYEYTTGSGKSETTHTFSFVKIKLPRRLPNIVIESKGNNTFGNVSNLPAGFSKDQKLSLEGDFDSYFTLYTPVEYKRDALYIFTPDVMQALIDSAKDYDCEVIDDNFYIYIPETLDVTDAKELQDILSIASKLRTELISQTDYYADERVGNRALNTIGATGVRLKKRMSTRKIIGIIIISIVVIYQVAPLIVLIFFTP